MVAMQRWRWRQRGSCRHFGGNAAVAAAGNVTVVAAAWLAVLHQRGGGGGSSAAVTWRPWRWRQCGSSAAAAAAPQLCGGGRALAMALAAMRRRRRRRGGSAAACGVSLAAAASLAAEAAVWQHRGVSGGKGIAHRHCAAFTLHCGGNENTSGNSKGGVTDNNQQVVQSYCLCTKSERLYLARENTFS